MRWWVGIGIAASCAVALWFAGSIAAPTSVVAPAFAAPPPDRVDAVLEATGSSALELADATREARVEVRAPFEDPNPILTSDGAGHGVLRGRLLDSRGAPIRGARVWTPSIGWWQWTHSNTGADGRFELMLRMRNAQADPTVATLRQVRLHAQPRGPAQQRVFDLSESWWPGELDVGDWQLEADFVVARVRVRDELDALIDPLDVVLERRSHGLGQTEQISSSDLLRVGAAEVELRDLKLPARVQLRARRESAAGGAWVDVDPIGRAVDLHLMQGGAVRGAFLVDPSVSTGRVAVRLRCADRPEFGAIDARTIALEGEPDGAAWEVAGLAEGAWRVELVSKVDGGLFATRDAEVRANHVHDSGTVDLRGAIERWELSLRASDGAQLEHGWFAYTCASELQRNADDVVWGRGTIDYGRALLRTARAPLRLATWAPGYRLAVVDIQPGDRATALVRAPVDVIHSAGGPDRARLEWVDAPLEWRALRADSEFDLRASTCRVDFPGGGWFQLVSLDGALRSSWFACPYDRPAEPRISW